MGELFVEGADAGKALAGALVTDPPSLAGGRAHYSMICAPDGGILDDLIVYRLAEERFLVVANAANAVASYIEALPGRVWATITNLWNTAVSLTASGINAVASWVGQLPGRIAAFVSSAWEQAKSLFASGVNAVVSFVLIGTAVYFFVVVPVNALMARMRRGEAPPDPTSKKCPECLSAVPIAAKRCAFCVTPGCGSWKFGPSA